MSGFVHWGAATPAAEEWLARRWEAIAEAFARKNIAVRHAEPDCSEHGCRDANAAFATVVVADASWVRGDAWWRWCSAHPSVLAFPVSKPLLPPSSLTEIPRSALAAGAERILADSVLTATHARLPLARTRMVERAASAIPWAASQAIRQSAAEILADTAIAIAPQP